MYTASDFWNGFEKQAKKIRIPSWFADIKKMIYGKLKSHSKLGLKNTRLGKGL